MSAYNGDPAGRWRMRDAEQTCFVVHAQDRAALTSVITYAVAPQGSEHDPS